MPTSATDVLSLDQTKLNLSLGGVTTESRTAFIEMDTLLNNLIEGAVEWAAHRVNVPLLDRDEVQAVYPESDSPILLRKAYVKAVKAISYWTPTGKLRDQADGSLAVATLGRNGYQTGSDFRYEVYPPSTGWPTLLADSAMNLTITRGIADTDVPTYRELVMLYVRHTYDQEREIKPYSALNLLVSQLQDWR